MLSPSTRGLTRGTALAYDLHRSVPADRWCVTQRDLRFLRQEVRSALRHGRIRPGDEDDGSEVYGPSIYTVNEQYIKPVTRQAGKMSWALMRHPEGLECELFISHAWQEGVFEFLKKVRHSWPRTLQTAWCCMLANPQNLDISSFLQSPKTSPFAVALAASKVMLVVPNRHQSVYTRLWCSYEAYLAQEDGKTILIARSSNLSQVLRALIWLLALAAILGLSLGILATCLEAHETFTVPALTVLVLGFSLLIDNDILRRSMHFIGVMLCWICVAHNFGGVFGEFMEGYYKHEGIPRKVMRLVHRCYWLLASVAFGVMELDRINGKSTVSEAEVDEVDHAIHVLMAAGMSTPALRDIARSVDIQHAAFREITGAIFLFGPFATNALTVTVVMSVVSFTYNERLWYRAGLAGVSVLSRLGLLVLLCRSDWDEQRFILKVMNKFLFVAMLGWLFLIPFFLSLHLSISTMWNVWLIIGDACLLSILSFALLGIRGTAKLPFGLKILQIFFSRGSNTWTALKLCVRSNPATSLTSDESSDDPDSSGNGS